MINTVAGALDAWTRFTASLIRSGGGGDEMGQFLPVEFGKLIAHIVEVEGRAVWGLARRAVSL